MDEVNELFEKSQREMDAKTRAAQFARIQEIHVDAAAVVYLYETPYPVALQSNVKGFYQLSLGNYVFAKTYIEK